MKLSKDEYFNIKVFILRKLIMHTVVGAKHTSPDNLQKSLPKHVRGYAKEVVVDMIKEGLLLSHPTSYGIQISLNPSKLDDIKSFLTSVPKQ